MEDIQLVSRVLKGQTKSYGEIVSRYSAMVFAKALGIVKDKDLAAEITQQTFIKAYTRLDTWKGAPSIGPWLATIAVHLSINMLDEARRRRTRLSGHNEEPEGYSAEHEELLQRVEKAVDNLKEPDKSIIRMHYYHRQTAEEIGHALHLTTSNVLVRLHRVRQQLKNQLTRHNNE